MSASRRVIWASLRGGRGALRWGWCSGSASGLGRQRRTCSLLRCGRKWPYLNEVREAANVTIACGGFVEGERRPKPRFSHRLRGCVTQACAERSSDLVTPAIHFYMDDSGSRDLDRSDERVGSKWFALGGVLVKEEDEGVIRDRHQKFCSLWDISAPLHSYPIRNTQDEFAWIRTLSAQDKARFFSELSEFLFDLPVLGMACVVDRQGYNARYKEKYKEERWSPCKTAFSIAVERAAKYAHRQGRRLKVLYERSDRDSESKIEGYYRDLRADGMPFAADTSSKYRPFGQGELRHTLWECRKKAKSSPPMQIADLFLFPICVGGYDPDYRIYKEMRARKLVLDDHLEEAEAATMGVKYSCFEARIAEREGFPSLSPAAKG